MKLTNHTLHPFHMVVAQIQHDNPDAGIGETTIDNYAYRNIKGRTPVDGEEPLRNTSIEIDLLADPSDVDGDWVTFNYHRWDIHQLFIDVINSGKNNVKEWELVVDENGIVQSGFEEKIKEIFGLYIEADDGFYTLVKEPYSVKLIPTPENPAFGGEVTFEIIQGLKSRIGIKGMDGFTAPYSEPRLIGDIKLVIGEFSPNGRCLGNYTSITEDEYRLLVTVDKDYSDTKGIVVLDKAEGIDLPPGVDANPVERSFEFLASVISNQLTVDMGSVEDGYNLNLTIENAAGTDTLTNRIWIGTPLEERLSLTHTGNSVVDKATGSATFNINPAEDMLVNITGLGGTKYLLNGAELQAEEILVAGESYTLQVHYNSDGVEYEVGFDIRAVIDEIPSIDRRILIGNLTKTVTVKSDPTVNIVDHSFGTPVERLRDKCQWYTVTANSTFPYKIEWYFNDELRYTTEVNEDYDKNIKSKYMFTFDVIGNHKVSAVLVVGESRYPIVGDVELISGVPSLLEKPYDVKLGLNTNMYIPVKIMTSGRTTAKVIIYKDGKQVAYTTYDIAGSDFEQTFNIYHRATSYGIYEYVVTFTLQSNGTQRTTLRFNGYCQKEQTLDQSMIQAGKLGSSVSSKAYKIWYINTRYTTKFRVEIERDPGIINVTGTYGIINHGDVVDFASGSNIRVEFLRDSIYHDVAIKLVPIDTKEQVNKGELNIAATLFYHKYVG